MHLEVYLRTINKFVGKHVQLKEHTELMAFASRRIKVVGCNLKWYVSSHTLYTSMFSPLLGVSEVNSPFVDSVVRADLACKNPI